MVLPGTDPTPVLSDPSGRDTESKQETRCYFTMRVRVAWAQHHSVNNNKGERSKLGLQGFWQNMLAAFLY